MGDGLNVVVGQASSLDYARRAPLDLLKVLPTTVQSLRHVAVSFEALVEIVAH